MGRPRIASERRNRKLPRPEDPRSTLLRTYRVFAVIAGVLIPSFWVVYKLTDPTVVDPLWIRVLLSGLTFAFLGLSYRIESLEQRFIPGMQALLYLYTVWFIALLAANTFSPNYALGLLFVIAAIAVAISTGLDRPQPLFYYLAFATGLTTVVVLLVGRASEGAVGRVIFVGLVFSLCLVIYVAANATIRAQRQLVASEQKYRKLFSSASDAIVVIDPETHRVVEVNEKAEDLYGYTTQEIIGLHIDDLAGEYADKWFAVVPAENIEIVHRKRDGTPLTLLVSTARIQYEDRNAFLSINHDITERLETMQQLAEANKALMIRNRELRDFTSAASHDLQEPLRKIRTFADLLEREHGSLLPEDGRGYLGRIQDIAAHMSRLIADLLSFTHVTAKAEPFKEVNLEEVVSHVRAELSGQIRAGGIEFEVGELPVIEAAPSQMYWLIRHLMENAIKFRREYVPLRIEIKAEMEGESEGGPTLCRLEISDNGVGFDEKYLGRIFSPFEQLDRNRSKGTGMGLAICKRIVERHSGTISAKSNPGMGSTFIVELPVRQATSRRVA